MQSTSAKCYCHRHRMIVIGVVGVVIVQVVVIAVGAIIAQLSLLRSSLLCVAGVCLSPGATGLEDGNDNEAARGRAKLAPLRTHVSVSHTSQ